MKKIVFILLLAFIFSCKSDPKKEKENNIAVEQQEEKTEKERLNKDYPVIEYQKQLTYIYEDGYMFSDDIELIDIGIALNDDASYDFVLYFEKSSNLELLSRYTVGLITYPENTDEVVKKGFPTDIRILEDFPVIMLSNFETKFKNQRLVKLYLYDKTGVLNDKMLRIQKITFP